MPVQQHLACQGRSKIPVVLGDVGDRQLPDMRPQPTIGGPPAGPVPQTGRPLIGKQTGEPMRLAPRDTHETGRRSHRQAACKNRRQHLSAAKLPFAHLHPAHASLPCTFVQGSVTFLVCHGGTF